MKAKRGGVESGAREGGEKGRRKRRKDGGRGEQRASGALGCARAVCLAFSNAAALPFRPALPCSQARTKNFVFHFALLLPFTTFVLEPRNPYIHNLKIL